MKKIFYVFLLLSIFINGYLFPAENKFNLDLLAEEILLKSNLEVNDENKKSVIEVLNNKLQLVEDMNFNLEKSPEVKVLLEEISSNVKKVKSKQQKRLTVKNIKNLVYIGGLLLVGIKFNFVKDKFNFWKNKLIKLFDHPIHKESEEFVFNSSNDFDINGFLPKDAKKAKSFYILFNRLYLENLIAEADLINLRDIYASREPSKKYEYLRLLDIMELFEEDFGKSETRKLRHHLEHVDRD